MFKKILIVSGLLFGSWASASTVSGAKISRIHLNSNGYAYIKLDQSRTTTCADNDGINFYTIDLSTRFGELQYSHALSIFHAQSSVVIVGTNSCQGPHNIEAIADFQVYK